ncbi:bifunctional phosphoribosylaminoimidazolecarboxamide formyltransferase/IMP cyclohydrolase [Schleiferia thermophila]|uniref:bifunctional phosphoribosylaminoimidazolecarboxamide formyltransferase/IMP cyclohydrolase n=1 Tax=Schleiferia thermophila TaxID=884107 RepID=UPI0004E74FC4|nr:bifunctional phosphoribosylaminoimidazolecarboxamide formyltransferase/IMP cyclohydrolase [Schleiferia thermophila]KFD39543.1 phosphoribosylaminoimidazolecarboxamide formyltransferase [Schleiferia thermophila str. Yellowstone]PMB38133.1 bifunctional phosphoribosylaminoimidazolecarboxamide formyltransferase/inosine monophosphate cyclohydrolase [Fischerella thermalis CCMEE 5319]
MSVKKIKTALISVFYKDGLERLVRELRDKNVEIFSTGGTLDYIQSLGIPATSVKEITEFPEILGGRVKTLHPAVFGGILRRDSNPDDLLQISQYGITPFDLVVVDLYPFEETVKSGKSHQDIIEKIDIGGISLIRAAAKNFTDVAIVSSRFQYDRFLEHYLSYEGCTDLDFRKELAREAFRISSSYDRAIFHWFSDLPLPSEKVHSLRYGENPHQRGWFEGDLSEIFTQLSGKELSYNNLLDIDAALAYLGEFDETSCVIVKHNNACGLASRTDVFQAWTDALKADPVSAFGGIIAFNAPVDTKTAEAVSGIFFEVLLAPGFDSEALELLRSKKNRIIVQIHPFVPNRLTKRSALNGYLVQDRDLHTDSAEDFKYVTRKKPTHQEVKDLIFASKISKHTRSNTIVLAKDHMLLAAGTGQTSRVDALRQAILKAQTFGLSLQGAVMASDAFFPFPDCVEIAHQAGITAIVQPGGSIKDQLSIDYCNQHDLAMVFTGFRHFKH